MKLPRDLSGHELAKVLERFGYEVEHQTGSHLLFLHKRLADAKMASDKKTIGQQIKITDRQIDQLVYELYELTGEAVSFAMPKATRFLRSCALR